MNLKSETKGRREVRWNKGAEISGVDRKRSVYVAACVMQTYRRAQGDRGEERVEDEVVDVDFVGARGGGGGAGDCSPRLKSREPLLNGELARISRAWIYSKMPSLSSSKLCPFRPFLLKGRVSNGNSSPIVCVTLSPDEIDIVYNKYERKGKETGTIVRFVDNFWRGKNKCWGKLCHLIVSDNWWKGDLIRIWKTLYRALKDKRNKFL